MSRAKISGGLKTLVGIGAIEKKVEGKKNKIKIQNYGTKSGWAKLPARGLYNKGRDEIPAFHKFNLRTKNELNALKIYLLIIVFRDNSTNYAMISYDRISEYTGIHKSEIKSALSLLINIRLVQVESGKSDINEYATVNHYRLCHLEAYKHRGTMAKEILLAG